MFTLFILTSLLVTVIDSEVIQVTPCSGDKNLCELKEIRVDPCRDAKRNKPCKFKSGTNATIGFDYVLGFDADRLVNQAYSVTPVLDLPLLGMDRDGCKYTKCPTESGQNGTYQNSLYISPSFPLLNYNVKWRVWDADNSENECCFTFRIKIIR